MSMRLGPQPAPDLNDPFAGDPDVPGEAPSASVVAPAETSTSLAPQVIERLNAVPWMAEEDAAVNEARHGRDVVRSGETLEGAARFAGGAGRGGTALA